jgi:hypothetical protein
MSQDMSVGTETGRLLDDRDSILHTGKRFALFSTTSRSALGPKQPPVQWVPGEISPGVKRPALETDHSLKNGEAVLGLPICLQGVMLC